MKLHLNQRLSKMMLITVFAISMMAVPSIFAEPMVQTIYSWSGSLTPNASFDRPAFYHGTCHGGLTGTTTYFKQISFKVDPADSYTFVVSAFGNGASDSALVLYQGFNPSSPDSNCLGGGTGSSHHGAYIKEDLQPDTIYTLVVTSVSASTAASFTVDFKGEGHVYIIEPSSEGGIPDGRINRKDAGPVVVFPDYEGGIHVYSPEGVLLTTVSGAEFDAVGVPSDENAIIKQESGVTVVRLTTGEYQVNAYTWEGKLYTFIFDAPTTDSTYTSFEAS